MSTPDDFPPMPVNDPPERALDGCEMVNYEWRDRDGVGVLTYESRSRGETVLAFEVEEPQRRFWAPPVERKRRTG